MDLVEQFAKVRIKNIIFILFILLSSEMERHFSLFDTAAEKLDKI